MRIVTFLDQQNERIGLVLGNMLYPCHLLSDSIPSSLLEILQQGDAGIALLNSYVQKLAEDPNLQQMGVPLSTQTLLAPLPNPGSFRDAYAFRQHVETSRANRGLDMIPEFDDFPVFYFSNHRAIQGPGPIFCRRKHLQKLDFELEVAAVIHKEGRNIKAADADSHIAGFMILNDFSARQLQMEEMKLNLGPAKGKDFASSFGPYFVSKEELSAYQTAAQPGHIGEVYDLQMSCRVNDILVSQGNLATMHWTFAEIIERASYGVTLYPGDIIGSGTVGTGCFLELNGTGKRNNPDYREQWLQLEDEIVLEVSGLGSLYNRIELED